MASIFTMLSAGCKEGGRLNGSRTGFIVILLVVSTDLEQSCALWFPEKQNK